MSDTVRAYVESIIVLVFSFFPINLGVWLIQMPIEYGFEEVMFPISLPVILGVVAVVIGGKLIGISISTLGRHLDSKS